jgi:cholesterol 7-dehydrogenase
MRSRARSKGEARDFELLGHFFVVYRGEDGKARILDAYCPHLGAHLGVTGQVVGNEIACPFHGWQFNGEGQCTHIPYAEKVPGFIKTNSWHCTEINGAILIWHDAEGRAPLWMPPEIKEISSGRFKWHGSSLHQVRAHIQEIPENGPDTAHLNILHVPLVIRFLYKLGFTHSWEASWEPGQGVEEHLAHIKVIQSVKFKGIHVPGSRVNVTITQVGPAMVHLNFATALGSVIVIETVTPIQPLLQRFTHQVFAEWTIPRFVAKFFFGSTITQVERDVPIWNNKTYLPQPTVIKEDGPITKYRRWFAKNFYSKNSEQVARDRASNTGSIEW